jgi:hypothetical protein
MNIVIVKILVIVSLTHALRWVSHIAGPRWGGLIAGLPMTSAVVLFFLAAENGEAYAARAANSGAVGIAAGAALAMIFAWAVRGGQPPALALFLAGIAFLAVAATAPFVLSLPQPMPLCIVISACCLLAAFAQGLQGPVPHVSCTYLTTWSGLALRTVIPAACVLTVTALSQKLGAGFAGLVGTFPCMLTSMLVVTSLEDGPAAAGKLAKAFPVGQLATLSFVALFGLLCPAIGGTAALVTGYLAAIATLLFVELVDRIQREIRPSRVCTA